MQPLEDRLAQPDMVGKTDSEAATILNAKDEVLPWIVAPIAIRDVLFYLQQWGAYGTLQFYAQRGDLPVAELAIRVLSTIDPARTPFPTMDVTDSTIAAQFQAMGAGLIAAGVLTQAQYDFLWNLRMVPQSWAQANETEVTSRTVGIARGANPGV
jgi:hypothetical protein